jgi:hypothetical protein
MKPNHAPREPADLTPLIEAIRRRAAYLFVGAGVSISVGLPSWQTFIEHLESELGFDSGSAAERQYTYQMLADYYVLQQGSIGGLRSWMDRTWSVSTERVARSELHKLIVGLDFPVIYTTNYDRNLEVAYEQLGHPYTKIGNAKDIALAEPGRTQIVKFHGDFDDDASLVLTETDYFDRLSFESPLDVKFRSDALGHTLLFVGYSMSDMNIRLLLHKLWQTWERSGQSAARPSSFVFTPDPNPVQEAVLARWGLTVISGTGGAPEMELGAFLQQLAEATKR